MINVDDIKNEITRTIQLSQDTAGQEANPFPVEILPVAIQQIIKATNETLHFPIDFIGASILFTASVGIGNSYKVEIKSGWQESAVLYMAIVARAGTNKSHPLSYALNPIYEQDKRTFELYEMERKEYEKAISLSKKGKIEKGQDSNGELPKKPKWEKYLVTDFTPEALALVHYYNQRGIGVYVDELAGWIKNFNRYNKGSEMEFWLSCWSGKPINIDRKTSEPIYISMPFIPVCGTIQNNVLNEFARDNRNQNGFIDRILFVMPDNVQKTYWTDEELNPEVSESWRNIVLNLLFLKLKEDEFQNKSPNILRFSPEAKAVLSDWQKTNTDRSNNTLVDEYSGMYSKLEVYAIRLSLILEMLSFACNEGSKNEISVKSVKGAIALIEYFGKCGKKVRDTISNADHLEVHPENKKALYEALPFQFSTNEGVKIAESYSIPARTFKRFINDKELFKNISWGVYEKLF